MQMHASPLSIFHNHATCAMCIITFVHQIIPLSVIKIKRCLILLGFELSIQVMSNAKFEFFAVLQNSGKAQASETVMM